MSNTFDFPHHGEREYISAIDIAAVITVRDPAYRLMIRATRDIEQTFNAMRSSSAEPLILVNAFWVSTREIADKIAKAANGDPGPWLTTLIDVEAKRLGALAVPHDVVMKRIRAAGGNIDAALQLANERGDLKWFNKAYQLYRQACGGSGMNYPTARARLRRVVVRNMVMSGTVAFSADMARDVFRRPVLNIETAVMNIKSVDG